MLKSLNRRAIGLFILVLFSISVKSQTSNLELVNKQSFYNPEYDERKISYLFSDVKNPIIKYNPISITLGSLLYFYQALISVQIASKCSYEISCSNFSKLAIKEYGILKGVALASDRLMRCNQYAAMDLEDFDINFKKMKIKDDIHQYRIKKYHKN